LLVYEIVRWKVSKANSKKHLEMVSKVVEWQKQNRRLLYFNRSTYSVLKTEDPSVETWINIDEYKDQESYDKFTKTFKKSNPEWAEILKLKDEWVSLIVPNSLNDEVFIEKPELRIA
jgi:hypothetical protein